MSKACAALLLFQVLTKADYIDFKRFMSIKALDKFMSFREKRPHVRGCQEAEPAKTVLSRRVGEGVRERKMFENKN